VTHIGTQTVFDYHEDAVEKELRVGAERTQVGATTTKPVRSQYSVASRINSLALGG